MPPSSTKKTTALTKTTPIVRRFSDEYLDQPEQVIASMEPPLRDLYKRVKSWFDHQTRQFLNQTLQTIRDHYQLGEMVRDFVEDCNTHFNTKGRYGREAARQMTLALGNDFYGTILKAAKFVRAYTREEMELLCQRQNQDGRPITWSHIGILILVDDRKVRQELLDQAMGECWTCLDLFNEIKRRLNWGPDPRGRPMSTPKTLHKAVLQQESFADQFLARNSKVWEGAESCLTARVDDTPRGKITEEVVAGLKATADKWHEVARKAQKRAEEAQAAYEVCHRILAASKPAPALPPPPGPKGAKNSKALAKVAVKPPGPAAEDSLDEADREGEVSASGKH
jgi:hypothetical protein